MDGGNILNIWLFHWEKGSQINGSRASVQAGATGATFEAQVLSSSGYNGPVKKDSNTG